jgi:hypothetical protein
MMPVIATVTAATMSLVSAPAWGCPACAANGGDANPSLWYALAGIVGAPFVIGAIAFVVIRGLARDDRPI